MNGDTSPGMADRVAVFGIGNVLIGDDALGPTVIAFLEAEYDFPESVVVKDLGTPSLDLAAYLADFDHVILVDAVSAQLPPGTIRIYTLDEILKHPPGLRLSPHDPSLTESLLTALFVSDKPRHVRLVGIVPESIEEFGLSETARAAVPRAAEAVLRELLSLGVSMERKQDPRGEPPWWIAA